MKTYYLALDLKNDPVLIKQYENLHQKIWPEKARSIKDSGILQMKIYRVANRLFMIIEANDDFSFDRKRSLDEGNPKVKEWEDLTWHYQQALPDSVAGEKWRPMDLHLI